MTGTGGVSPRSDRASRLLRRLRTLMPERQLEHDEALQIAERQAGVLRRELGLSEQLALPVEVIASLPFLRVALEAQMPTSGALLGTREGWVIAVKAEDATVRQRFSLLHELKHLLDDPYNGPEKARFSHHDPHAERTCNHFAACALMPRPALKRDWGNGIQKPTVLAARYGVSLAAMSFRLQEIGLVVRLRHGDRPELTPDEQRALTDRLARRWEQPTSATTIASLHLNSTTA